MKVTAKVFDNDDGENSVFVGEIWTDGKRIFIDPVNNPLLKYMANNPIQAGSTVLWPEENPVRFVKNLCITYRDTSEAIIED